MKKKRSQWAVYLLYVILFLIFAHALRSLIAYGLFGTIAGIGLLCSGDTETAAETFLQIAFYVTSAACVIPGVYTLYKQLGEGFPHRHASPAPPISIPLAVASLVLQISVFVVAVTFPDSPYMAIYIPCFILLGLLMLASWKKRRKKH